VFLVTLVLGRPAGEGGSPGSALLSEAFERVTFVHLFSFVEISLSLFFFFFSRPLPGMS
jgi:hypothetical protein